MQVMLTAFNLKSSVVSFRLQFIVLFFFLFLNAAIAQEEESHNFVQLNYVAEYSDDEEVDPSGWGILARFDAAENLFIRAEFEKLSDADVDVTAHALAVAYVFNPHAQVAYHIAALIEHEDESDNSEDVHALGKGLELGFHAEFTHKFVLHGELSLVTENNEETVAAELGLLYNFAEPFGINIEFGIDEDHNSAIEIGLRYTFE